MDPNTLTTIAMIALMIVAFYFLILRPQRKRRAEQTKTLESLTPGSRVLTSTGIYGNLVRIGDKQAVIELTPGHEMTMVKHAIVRVVQPGEEDLGGEGLATDDHDDELSEDEFSENEISGDASDQPASSANWQEYAVGSDEGAASAEKSEVGQAAYPSYAPKETEVVEGEVSDTTDADGTKRN